MARTNDRLRTIPLLKWSVSVNTSGSSSTRPVRAGARHKRRRPRLVDESSYRRAWVRKMVPENKVFASGLRSLVNLSLLFHWLLFRCLKHLDACRWTTRLLMACLLCLWRVDVSLRL
ncbi:hypothetical protein D1007_07260 [Hordeum vulgare]|nr:hypothetical protein D1007_07260 [Hordeum vulgare]